VIPEPGQSFNTQQTNSITEVAKRDLDDDLVTQKLRNNIWFDKPIYIRYLNA